MGRILTAFGVLVGVAGVLGGGVFIYLRRVAFLESNQVRADFLGPLKWQISLGSGIALIIMGLVLGLLLIGVGRVLDRLDALQPAEHTADV